MSWWDRVLSEPVDAVPADAIPGRYLVVTKAPLVVGGVFARAGDHLAANASGHWSIAIPNGPTTQGEFAEVELLRALESSTVIAIAERLDPDARGALDWSRLTTESPLVHPTPEHLEATPLDREITRHGPHLQEVCRRPHSMLEAIIEPTLASRAKRIPPRAVQYLASHSEDWHRRTVTSVIPRRVLAQHIDERLDVYENRVAARLIDRMITYFRTRLADLRQLEDLFADIADFSGALSTQHRVARRLSELWGEGFGEGDELERIGRLEKALLDRRRRIGGLQDSDLYRAVPRRAKVAGQLRQTNVLTDHQHYRRVAALWRAFNAKSTAVPTKSDDYVAWQRLMHSFDAYCLLLVSAALERLGFKPMDGARIELTQPGRIKLSGPLGTLDLHWDPMRGATIHAAERAAVRFVPLAASLSGVDEGASETNERRAAARVDELTRSVPRPSVSGATVLLYAGTRRQRGVFPSTLSGAFNPDDVGLLTRDGDTTPELLPVSPLDILSLERVERVVRRVVLGSLFDQFPPTATCRRNVRDRLSQLADWLEATESRDHLTVLAPPDGHRLAQLASAITRANRALRPRHDDAIRHALDAFLPAVERTRSFFDQIRWCPVCGGIGSFRGRGASHFVVDCGSCGSQWGLHACGSCGARVPYLDAGAKPPEQHHGGIVLDLLDRSYGRDVLAVPCLRAEAGDAYVCPNCRACPGGAEPCGPNCARATSLAPLARVSTP